MASIYKRGHVWWMKKKVNGKWKSFSLDTKSKRDAQQYLRELDEKKDTGDALTTTLESHATSNGSEKTKSRQSPHRTGRTAQHPQP
jgi:hypothetical protein